MLRKPFALTPMGSENFLTKRQKIDLFSPSLQIQDSKSKHFNFPTDLPGRNLNDQKSMFCFDQQHTMLNATQLSEKSTNNADFFDGRFCAMQHLLMSCYPGEGPLAPENSHW